MTILYMTKFEYAGDAALVDDDAVTAKATRVTAIASGYLNDAAIDGALGEEEQGHLTTRVSATNEAEVIELKLKLKHPCHIAAPVHFLL